jgi:predicted CXXCH cytochrome family protein
MYGLMTAVAVFGFGSAAYAFHDGGVAECSGCHSMHSSPVGAVHLTIAVDQSSTCLSCHESVGDTGPTRYHMSTPAAELALGTDIPIQRTPGGDFGWIRQNFTATASYGAPVFNNGKDRGHNIQAGTNYAVVDGLAPGGTMNSNVLTCTSCHDPHSRARRIADGLDSIVYPPTSGTYDPITESGSYGHIPVAGEAAGVYRLLGGPNYVNPDNPAPFPGIPAAVVPSSYNQQENTPANQIRVTYGHGTANGYTTWANWCATCHPNYHTSAALNTVHVVDAQLTNVYDVYNKYVKTGDLTGLPADSFNSLVPFAKNSKLIADLTAPALLDGPVANDRIVCLSCHRAHASGWKYSLRWNNEAEFLTLESGGLPIYPGVNAGLGNQGQFNQGYTIAQMVAAYNGRPAQTWFAAHQRSMCNKCHNKD